PTTPPDLYTPSLHDALPILSDHQSTVIVHPPKATFNDPTPAVSLSHTDGTATTGFAAFSLNGGNGGFDPPSAQPDSERTAVISLDRKSTRLNSSHVKISYAV